MVTLKHTSKTQPRFTCKSVLILLNNQCYDTIYYIRTASEKKSKKKMVNIKALCQIIDTYIIIINRRKLVINYLK